MPPLIKQATLADLSWMARFHEETFRPMLSARLGRGFLERYYSRLLEADDAAAWILWEGNERHGMIAGARDRSRVMNRALTVSALGNLAVRLILPSYWKEIPRVLYRNRFETELGESAQLVSVAIVPDARGKGYGALLIDTLEAWFASAGIRDYYVMTTANMEGFNAAGFYARTGFCEFARLPLWGYDQIYLRKRIAIHVAGADGFEP